MNRGLGALIGPLVALAALAFVIVQTLGALRTAGAFGHGGPRVVPLDDPYVAVDTKLGAQPPPLVATALRDPFGYGGVPVAAATGPRKPRLKPPPAPPPQPVLTAIVWDADPRAIVRWKDRDWTIRAGALFDDFQVTSITRNEVTLVRDGTTFVLHRNPQGE